jgi:PKD repeat protein
MLNFKTLPLFCCKTCIVFVLSIMRGSSRSLVLPVMRRTVISASVLAIAIILLAPNIIITNAQQQQQQPLISQPSPVQVTQNGTTTLFQSTTDGIRLNVPEGWIIQDVNNTGSTFSEESRQGYGILAQLCPQELLQQQQEQQRTALSNISRSRDTVRCQGSGGDIIHIVRYPDLDVRLQEVSSNITAYNNMTIDNILLYHMQKLEQVGYSRIQIVNSTDTTLNVTNAQTNQIIATVPARLVEVTYSTASAPNVIREGYFMLTATDETRPNIGITKGYSIFYEGPSIAAGAATPATIQQTTTTTPSVGLAAPTLPPLPIAVQQIFDSFKLIVAPEVAQNIPAVKSVQAQEVREDPSNPLTVDITSNDTRGVDAQQQQPLISQSPTAVSQNGTRLFESTEDSFRLQVPEGWIIQDVNNTGSMFLEESRQGYGILAQLCPQELLQQQQEQQRTALSNNISSSGGGNTVHCQESGGDIIHIVRYPDLDARLKAANNITTTTNNNNMTIDNILLYHMQKLEQVGYRNIEIVNNTDTTLNVMDPQTNQTIATVPARLVEMTYSTASAPNVIREGYFISTATNATAPYPGITKGYSIFYEGNSTTSAVGTATPATIQQTTTTPSVGLAAPTLPPLPIAVQQIFESFELIAAPEVAQDMLAAQSEQAQEAIEEEEPTSSSLAVDITSSDTDGEEDTAPATFEFEADVSGGTEPYTYRWNFDDDDSSEEGSDEQTVSHTFEEAGTYNVRLTVTDSSGQSASDSIEITVEEEEEEPAAADEIDVDDEEEQPVTIEQPIRIEQPLTVDITSSDTERGRVVAPATFEFEADVSGGTEPYTYRWNFDDDDSSEESDDDETISHTFEEAGTYNVRLTVTDSSGQRASDSMRITVEEEPSPSPTIIEPSEREEDDISENNLPPQQEQQDSGPPTAPTEKIPAEQSTTQGSNQGGEQREATAGPDLTQSIQQNASQNTQVGIPNDNQGAEATTEPHTSSLNFDDNGDSSSEERSDEDDDDENTDHISDEAGSHNGDRTVTDSEDQRVSNNVGSKVETPSEEPQEETPAEQSTAAGEEAKPDLSDADNNNSGSDDLIDVDKIFNVDRFIDGLFDKLGLDN